MRHVIPGLERIHCIAAGATLYLLLCTVFSRNPKRALLASIMVVCAFTVLFGNKNGAGHWALQFGLVFLLLHSLRWEDAEHPGAVLVRNAATSLWILSDLVWTRSGAEWWMPGIFGFLVLGGCVAARLFRGRWDRRMMAVAAMLVVLSGPGNVLFEQSRSMSGGIIAVIGSFLLFIAGTALALTKDRWHPTDPTENIEQ
jgi:hypothetical protein